MFFNYFRLELKNCIKILGKSILAIFFLCTAILAVAIGSSILFGKSVVFNTIDIAIVLPGDKMDSKWAVEYLTATESVESVCNIIYFDNEEAAYEELLNGKINAIISLPANFYQDIDTGVNTPVSIFIPEHVSLNTSVFLELIGDGVSMLQISEAGVYSALDIADSYYKGKKPKGLGDDIAMLYVMAVLDRNSVFDKRVVSALGEVDMYQYYFTSAMLIVALCMSLIFIGMYRKKTVVMEEKLRVYGLNYISQSAVRVLVMTLMLWIMELLFVISAKLIAIVMNYDFIDISLGIVLGLLLLAVTIAAFFHLIFSIIGRSDYATSIFIVLNLSMIIISGLILPLAYFPGIVKKIGQFMPVNAWNVFVQKLLFDQVTAGNICGMLILLIFGFGIGTLVICKKR